MFRAEGLVRVFKSEPEPIRALDGVNICIAAGSFTAIVGPSGCGKTTMLRVLAGFDRPSYGKLWIADRLVVGPSEFVRPEHRNIGIVTQEGSLFPHLTVAGNIAYGLSARWTVSYSRAARRTRRERVEELLDLVGLSGLGERFPNQLSGGQQQRVALARALAPRPSAILLDEPFSALDAALRVDLRNEVRELLKQLGTTSVLVTHDQNEALSLADHVALMRNGRLVQDGAPYEVYTAPVDPEAAAFLGESVELPCRIISNVNGVMNIECALGMACVNHSFVHEDSGNSILMLRPEHLELSETSGTPASVVSANFFGHDGLAKLHLEDGSAVLVRMAGYSIPPVGSRVNVRLLDTSPPSDLNNPRGNPTATST